jgi:hypothetical protein
MGSTKQMSVSLLFGVRLHYFSPKEISQIYATIPGGGHATFSTEGQSTLKKVEGGWKRVLEMDFLS